jgi:high affinity Mn2+ porin
MFSCTPAVMRQLCSLLSGAAFSGLLVTPSTVHAQSLDTGTLCGSLDCARLWDGPRIGVYGSAGARFSRFDFTRVGVGGVPAPGFSTGSGATNPTSPGLVGVNLGYDWQSGPFVAGVQGDIAYSSLTRTLTNVQAPGLGLGAIAPEFDVLRLRPTWSGAVLARFGIAARGYLLYVAAGPGLASVRTTSLSPGGVPISSSTQVHPGFISAIGLEAAITPGLSIGIEYRFGNYAARTYSLGALAGGLPVTASMRPVDHRGTISLIWRPDTKAPKAAVDADSEPLKDFSIHAQATWFQQAVNQFREPYRGANSLIPGQARTTWTTTAYLGYRAWEGGEFYFNPEWAFGFGAGQTLGAAGFLNGEAQKAGAIRPGVRPQRYFFRQTFGFGGGSEKVEDGPNQIAGERDINRLTITVGKFAVGDIFDDNKYAHDPRMNFTNWAIWGSGAYDFPANLPGYTQGIVADFNRRDWAVRAGLFQVPTAPNSDAFDGRIGRAGGALVEVERRFEFAGRPGKLRLGAFINRGNTANYSEALTLANVMPGITVDDAAAATRALRTKRGFYANAEQQITDDIGVFARLSYNDGRNQILSFTDIDRSISAGVSIAGTSWNRPSDTIGIGGAINGLSASHRAFLAAGGTGLLIGDGALNYRPEQIIETYYSLALHKRTWLTLDYQFIANPAYNADRGPVHAIGARLHTEF